VNPLMTPIANEIYWLATLHAPVIPTNPEINPFVNVTIDSSCYKMIENMNAVNPDEAAAIVVLIDTWLTIKLRSPVIPIPDPALKP